MGEFAKIAKKLLKAESELMDNPEPASDLAPALDWKARLANQQQRLGVHIPTSEDEARAKAKANIEALQRKIFALGYNLRASKRKEEEPLLTDVGGGMPGREVVIDLPAVKYSWYDPKLRSKQAADQIPGGLADDNTDSDFSKKQISMGAKVEMEHTGDRAKAREISRDHLKEIPDYYTRLGKMEEEAKAEKKKEDKSEKKGGILDEALAPIRMAGESALAEATQAISDRIREGRRVTTDPGTLVSYYPQMALSVPRAFQAGAEKAEEDADKLQAKSMNVALEKARKEYEQALSAEYASHRGVKTAGELIDGLAQYHVKQGDGELNQLTGAYLALASLLGYGSHEASKAWVESRDPRRQKFEAVKEELRRKRMRQPAPILVDIAEPEPVNSDLDR